MCSMLRVIYIFKRLARFTYERRKSFISTHVKDARFEYKIMFSKRNFWRWCREKKASWWRDRGRGRLVREILLCCGIWSWSATIFVSLIFFRDWIRRILNSCTEWMVKRERWLRDHLARGSWKGSLKWTRCRRYRLWKLLGRIGRIYLNLRWGKALANHVSARQLRSARQLLPRISSSCSSGREKRKSVSGMKGRLIRPHIMVIWKW